VYRKPSTYSTWNALRSKTCQEGVGRVLDILRAELEVTMRSVGAASIGECAAGT
jgi:isopentenyl diphosphate isomerase/L-lactate dehydrogenase-like FMN-dependent dehydrogenase